MSSNSTAHPSSDTMRGNERASQAWIGGDKYGTESLHPRQHADNTSRICLPSSNFSCVTFTNSFTTVCLGETTKRSRTRRDFAVRKIRRFFRHRRWNMCGYVSLYSVRSMIEKGTWTLERKRFVKCSSICFGVGAFGLLCGVACSCTWAGGKEGQGTESRIAFLLGI